MNRFVAMLRSLTSRTFAIFGPSGAERDTPTRESYGMYGTQRLCRCCPCCCRTFATAPGNSGSLPDWYESPLSLVGPSVRSSTQMPH
jgi:hypothetical protein